MSENVHDIENLFHDSIEAHAEMPPEKVWDSIDHKLDKSIAIRAKRKYNQLKRLSAVLLLLLLGTVAYELLPEKRELKINIHSPANDGRQIKKVKGTSGVTTSAVSVQDKNAGKTVTSASPDADRGIGYPPDRVNAADKNENAGAVQNEKTNPVVPAEKMIAAASKSNAGYSNRLFFEKHTIDVSGKKINIPSVKKNVEKTAAGHLKYKMPHHPALDDELIDVNNDQDIVKHKNPGPVSVKSIQHAMNDWLVMPVTAVHTNISFTVAIKETRNKPGILFNPPPPVAITKNKHAFHFALIPFFAPQFNFDHIKDDDDHRGSSGQRQNDLDDIKNENNKIAYSLGVLIEIPLRKRWTLQTGLNYTNKSIEIEPKKIYARLDNDGTVKYRFDFSSGYTYLSPKTGATPVVGDSILATESNSNLQYIGIPLTINYTFFKGKFNLVPSIGAMVNFLVKEKMQTNILTGVSNEKEDITSIQGLKKVYFNTITGIAFQYNAGKKIAVSITPAANFALGTINHNAAAKSYPNSFSITAGLKIYF